jgi:CBS domain containing-hemolysin-like protein
MYLRGDLLVTDVNEYLDLTLPDEDADTLGGLVLVKLGRLPEVGDEVTFGGTAIRVEAVADTSVSEVSLQPVSDSNGQTPARQIGEWEVAEHE